MPSAKSYGDLHKQVTSRPGAVDRLAGLREQTLAEIGLFELRRALERSQTELAEEIGITQSAISQLERSGDVKLSTLRTYLEKLGARLELLAVFDEDDEEHVVTIHVGDRVGAS
jgi:predicted transcriptional regulator